MRAKNTSVKHQLLIHWKSTITRHHPLLILYSSLSYPLSLPHRGKRRAGDDRLQAGRWHEGEGEDGFKRQRMEANFFCTRAKKDVSLHFLPTWGEKHNALLIIK